MDLSDEGLAALYEKSKHDDHSLVGSEVRQLIGTIQRLQASMQAIARWAQQNPDAVAGDPAGEELLQLVHSISTDEPALLGSELPGPSVKQVVTVSGSDYSYTGVVVAKFTKARSDEVRFVVEDINGRLFIHNLQQIEGKRGMSAARTEKAHEIAEELREMVRGVPPEHRPEGMFSKAQALVYSFRGR